MPKSTIPIGVLFSTTGPYAALGAEGLAGALAAIAQVNADDFNDFILSPLHGDPGGVAEHYATDAREIVTRSGARHIVGCTTSWSRKEVIPVLEKYGTLLWYPCPYEGFECNENVVYLGACPNQHIVPLLEHILPRFGRKPFLVGSNYIWGWETNRIARDLVDRAGGSISGERFLPLGDTDVARLIAEIRAKRPDFVLNTLIGPSSYAFLAAYRDLADADPAFEPSRRPIVSCNLSENELADRVTIAAGHYSVAPYFRSLPTAANAAFLAEARAAAPDLAGVSAFFAHAYCAVRLIAAGIRATVSDAAAGVLDHAKAKGFASPYGPLRIDRATNHAILTPLIGRATAYGDFEIVERLAEAVIPDPYMARVAAIGTPTRSPHLRVVK